MADSGAMSRAVPSIVAAVTLCSTVVLAGCSDPAATLPVVKPSTQYPSTSATAAPSPTATATPSTPTLAPPTRSAPPPAVHEPALVEALVKGAMTAAEVDLAPSPGLAPADVVVSACAGGPSITETPSGTAVVRAWGSPDAGSGRVAVMSAVTYPDIASATRAAGPVLKAGGRCTAPTAGPGETVKSLLQRHEVVEGMPLARVDVEHRAGGKVTYEYIGVVQVGNAVLQLRYTGPDLETLHREGALVLGTTARDLQISAP